MKQYVVFHDNAPSQRYAAQNASVRPDGTLVLIDRSDGIIAAFVKGGWASVVRCDPLAVSE